jgi:signal peptidase II
MIRQKNIRSFLTYTIIALLIDQISKLLVVNFLSPLEPPTAIIGSLLRLKLTYNPYGVFGITFGPDFLYYALSLAGIALLIYVGLFSQEKISVSVFGFIVGGAIGNVIDRLRLEYVVDFIDMGIGDFRWFTYNFADAFITVGAIFLLMRELFAKKS